MNEKKQFIVIMAIIVLSFTGCPSGNNVCSHEGGTATCTEKAICSKCSEPYGNALGHAFTSSWVNDENQHWKVCVNGTCGAISGNGTTESAKSNHTGINWLITTFPTNSSDGEETGTCSVCNTSVKKALNLATFQTYFYGIWKYVDGNYWIEYE